MKFRVLLAAATCLALPVAAHAQPVTGPYVSLGLGTSLLSKTSFNYPNTFGEGLTGTVDFSADYATEASIGYGLGNGFRAELEGNYYRYTAHSVTGNFFNGASSTRQSGAESTYGALFNVFYDFSVGSSIFPYLGAGVGYEETNISKLYNNFDAGEGYVSGTKGNFAFQVIAGVSYPIAMVPGLSLTADYRFMDLPGSHNFKIPGDDESNAPLKLGSQTSHTFLLGLRYQLFPPPAMAPAPAPAPMAAPAPAPAKTYLVFFDWNKYDLTPRATQIIAEAASDSKTTKVTTINVSGYTDTSGTPTYNQGLSIRRAKAVAVKLMADGVPASEISIHGFGETHLLVPTGPGVREPQNRRVEIVLN
ncbi:MAG TPA: OmpA family protein [Acidocella sp.]|nr:OmpA family protein [Acidocella sp.]